MNCEELISLFNKVGGILNCDYNKKQIIVKNTNLKCDIQPKDYKKLELLSYEYAFSPYEIIHLKNNKMTMEECVESNIKMFNIYMKNNEYGFEIKYLH